LFRAAQAMSAIEGADSVSAAQVKALAGKVLAHRLNVRKEEKWRNTDVEEVVAEILRQTPMP
jgi:MoxR-like ATPase